ncbi:MAG: glycerophosphodiester phosphodiesterase family protein [Thermomonas sp.]
MRIKRFNAPDMRTALRMVREEQGPDAVILSSRQASDGVEVVAATDYDEAVVQQALRTIGAPEAPRATTAPAAPATPAAPAPAAAASTSPAPEDFAPAAAASTSPAPEDFAAVLRARLPGHAQGRAVFHVDGEPVPARSPRTVPTTNERPASRLEQVMAVLKGPRDAAPALPRALLLDQLGDDCLDQALALGCVALVCNHALWDAALVERARALGLRCLSYTVNDPWAAERLIALGTDGIITDRVDLFAPA